MMQRKHRQPDPHLKSTVKIPAGYSCQQAPRHFMCIIESALSYSLNISVLSSFLEARGLLVLYSHGNKLTVICRNDSLQAICTAAPNPLSLPSKRTNGQQWFGRGCFLFPGIFFNPLQFTTLAAEKQAQLAQSRMCVHQLHPNSPPRDEAEEAVMILTFCVAWGRALDLHDWNY